MTEPIKRTASLFSGPGAASAGARYFVPIVIGLAPAMLVALTWAPSGRWTGPELLVRDYAAPVIASELFVILVALREGMLKSLSRWQWRWPVLAATAILLTIATITAATAPNSYVSTVLSAYWIVHAVFGLSIAYLCGRIFAPQDLVRAYLAGFALVAAQFIVFAHQIPHWAEFDWRSGLPGFIHLRHAGYYLAAIAGLSIGVMAVAKHLGEWVFAFAAATVAIALAFWTGSRGAVLAAAGALAAGLFFAPPMRSLRGWGGGLASMIVAAAVVSQVPAAPHSMMGITRTVEATGTEDVTTGRTAMWGNVLGAIRERPVFGYGEGQMREVAPFSTMVQPHTVILQVALAWGIVGLLCILTLAVAFAIRAIPTVRQEGGMLVPAFLAMAAIATLSLYDGALYYALPTSIFVACGAVVASQWSSARRSHFGKRQLTRQTTT